MQLGSPRTEAGAYACNQFMWAYAGLGAGVTIWIRFPQVSSKTAITTVPRSVGAWVNSTPAARSRALLGMDVVDGELC